MPIGKTNNPEGKNQYSKGGGAAFGVPSFSGKNRRTTMPSPAGAGRGNVNPPNVNAMRPIAGLNYDVSNVEGGRGNYAQARVDPNAAAGRMGAALGGKAEAAMVKAKGAAQGAMATRAGGIKAALEGARQGAMRAELNFAENSRGVGAMRGEAAARKVADTVTGARIAATSAMQTAKEKAEPYATRAKAEAKDVVAKIKARMWGN